MEIIAENLDGGYNSIADYSNYYNEGDTGEVRFYLDRDLTDEEVADIEAAICAEGAVLTEPIVQDARVLIIPFRVAIWPLPIILGIVSIVGGVIGWQLFKDRITGWLAAPFGVPVWVWILGVGSGVALYFLYSSDKGHEPTKATTVQQFFLGSGKNG